MSSFDVQAGVGGATQIYDVYESPLEKIYKRSSDTENQKQTGLQGSVDEFLLHANVSVTR